MANGTQLQTLRARVRDRADMENSTFITDAQIDGYINAELFELYSTLVHAWEDYHYATQEVTLVSGTEAYTLSPVPLHILKVFWIPSSGSDDRHVVRKFKLDDLGRDELHYRVPQSQLINDYQYRFMGDKILVYPNQGASGFFEVWYVPQLTELSSDTDTVPDNIPNGWEDIVVHRAAARCAEKEESFELSDRLRAIATQKLQLVLQFAAPRDAGDPETITDVTHRFGYRRYY